MNKKRFALFLVIALALVLSACTGAIEMVSCDFTPGGYKITFKSGSTIVGDGITLTEPGIIELPVPEKAGYSFEGWFFDNGTFENELKEDSFVERLPSSKYTVVYAKWLKIYTVNVTGGGVDRYLPIENGKYAFKEGTVVSVVADMTEGMAFSHWLVTKASDEEGTDPAQISDNPVVLTVDDDYSFVAEFEEGGNLLTVTATEGGKVVNGATNYYVAGRTVVLKAEADEGYDFLGWKIGTETVSDEEEYRDFVMPAEPCEIFAVFGKKSYVLSVSSDLEGAPVTYEIQVSGEVKDSPVTVVFGESVRLLITQKEVNDMTFAGWYSDGVFVSDEEDFGFTMPAKAYDLVAHYVLGNVLVYDKASGEDFVVNCGNGYVNLIGAGIAGQQGLDYTINSGKATVRAQFLQSLPVGDYDMSFLKSEKTDMLNFVLSVVNSDSKPSDLKFDFDVENGKTFVSFKCECGGAHYISVDGEEERLFENEALESFDRTKSHTLKVKCASNGKTAQISQRAYTQTEISYFEEYFDYDGKQYDHYIDSYEEFKALIGFMTQQTPEDVGSVEHPFGSIKKVCYSGDNFEAYKVARPGYFNDAVNSVDSAWGYTLSTSSQALTPKVVTYTVSFATNPAYTYTTGMTAKDLTVENPVKRGNRPSGFSDFPIFSFSRERKIDNVVQLDKLSFGEKPVITDENARTVFETALSVCRDYISDDMTDFEKVTVFYEYLAKKITYDSIAYDLSVVHSSLDDQTRVEDQRDALMAIVEKYPTLETLLYPVMNETTSASLYKALNNLVQGMRVFSLEGAFVDNIAVCDGIASAFKLLCLIEGIECVEVSGTANGGNHAWNKVKIDGKWFGVDVTWGRQNENVFMNYLLVTDAYLYAGLHEEYTNGKHFCIENLANTEYDYYGRTQLGGHSIDVDNIQELADLIGYCMQNDIHSIEFRYDLLGKVDECIEQALRICSFYGHYSYVTTSKGATGKVCKLLLG